MNVDSEAIEADVVADVRNLPYAENSVDCVCAIHLIEHFYEWEALPVLQEWRRVLKPGGKLVLELPCMDKVFMYITECVMNEKEMVPRMTLLAFWGDPYQKLPGMHHKWGYTKQMMKKLLGKAGFNQIMLKPTRYHNPSRDMRFEAIK